jgi:hypothetical protein
MHGPKDCSTIPNPLGQNALRTIAPVAFSAGSSLEAACPRECCVDVDVLN